jgi:large subunit ribosomal protein L30
VATTLKVTLIRSPIRAQPKHKATVKALGLRRMHQTVEKPNNPQMRGMIRQIAHMLKVEAIEEQAQAPRRTAKAEVKQSITEQEAQSTARSEAEPQAPRTEQPAPSTEQESGTTEEAGGEA